MHFQQLFGSRNFIIVDNNDAGRKSSNVFVDMVVKKPTKRQAKQWRKLKLLDDNLTNNFIRTNLASNKLRLKYYITWRNYYGTSNSMDGCGFFICCLFSNRKRFCTDSRYMDCIKQ